MIYIHCPVCDLRHPAPPCEWPKIKAAIQSRVIQAVLNHLDKPKFDNAAWRKQYMREYMRKKRAKDKANQK